MTDTSESAEIRRKEVRTLGFLSFNALIGGFLIGIAGLWVGELTVIGTFAVVTGGTFLSVFFGVAAAILRDREVTDG